MKRGDLILVCEPGTPASKARPYVVVQRGSALDDPVKVTGCPLTSRLRGAVGQRPLVVPTAENNLRVASEVQVDWISTHPIGVIGGVIGSVDKPTLDLIDQALRRWLDV